LGEIWITVNPESNKQFITEKLTIANEYIEMDDLASVIEAIKEVQKVFDISSDNSEATSLKNKINDTLSKYRATISQWLEGDGRKTRPGIPKEYLEFKRLLEGFEFYEIIQIEQEPRNGKLLFDFYDASKGDLSTDKLVEKWKKSGNPVTIVMPKLSSPNRN